MTNNTIQEGVRKILEKHPEARDSYNWLWYYYMREIEGLNIFIPFEVLNGKKKIPSLESVTRACRRIQNEELVLRPTKKVQIIRSQRELAVSNWATKGSKNPLQFTERYVGW